MHETKIIQAVRDSIDLLLQKDASLLILDVNERSITHKLATYLEKYFPNWDVDCEYNRDGHEPKRLNLQVQMTSSDDSDGKTVFPDIIVHKRDTNKNLLVIEVKKSTNRDNGNDDIIKLKQFKRQLGYKYAAFLRLEANSSNPENYDLTWI